MSARTSWAFFRSVALGVLLFGAANTLAAQPAGPTIFTNAPPPAVDADAAVAKPEALEVYCVYKVGPVQGNCGQFTRGSKLCINCPGTGKCPGPAGQLSPFVFVDAAGNTICTGQWARAFDLVRPDACIECLNGLTGYVFVN